MDYIEGVNYMKSLKGSGRFIAYENIIINYPGRKRSGDYRLNLNNGVVPRHRDIARELYNLIHNGVYNYNQLRNLLEDIYNNGTNTIYEDEQLEYLKHLIYWITLQEDINYPRPNYAGINLVFTRFYEAIYSANPLSGFNIETVENRCDNYGRSRPPLYPIDNAPIFYHY